jgi:hypothetical protein
MTVEARELYSSSMGPIVSGSRTPFRANVLRVAIIQEIAAVPRGTASLHGHVPGDLLHPRLVRVNRDPGDIHPAVLEVDEFSVFIVRREPTPENS